MVNVSIYTIYLNRQFYIKTLKNLKYWLVCHKLVSVFTLHLYDLFIL